MKSKRNKLAGKHPSYAGMSKQAMANKLAYDKQYESTEDRKNYRVQLNRANRDAGTYGNGDGMDMSHTKKGSLVMERMRANRARNGRNKRSTKK